MRSVIAGLTCAAVVALVVTTEARGDGGPVPGFQGGAGVQAPRTDLNYVAVGGRRDETLVQRVRRGTGAVEAWTSLRGAWGIPGVGLDGSATGLSGDGRTLVLADQPARYPPRRTRLVVLDARRLRVRSHVMVPGLATVDAVSPSGRWLYLTA